MCLKYQYSAMHSLKQSLDGLHCYVHYLEMLAGWETYAHLVSSVSVLDRRTACLPNGNILVRDKCIFVSM